MFIVVSDESGDDSMRLDDAVEACNKYEIPVYVIGVPAPFGRDTTFVKWVDPDPQYDQEPQFAEVSQASLPVPSAPFRIKTSLSSVHLLWAFHLLWRCPQVFTIGQSRLMPISAHPLGVRC